MSIIVRSIVFAALALATVSWCRHSPPVTGGGEPGVVMHLPMQLPSFTGTPEDPNSVEKERLPSDTEFAKAEYQSRASSAAELDVVHCTVVLSGAERKSIHRPEVCLQGQDWKLIDSRIIKVDLGDGRNLAVKDLFIERVAAMPDGRQTTLRAHYVYWFIGADVTTPSHAERVWLTLWDNITRNINHRWAYTSMMALVTDNLSTEDSGQRRRDNQQTLEVVEKLIRELAPKFQKSLMH